MGRTAPLPPDYVSACLSDSCSHCCLQQAFCRQTGTASVRFLMIHVTCLLTICRLIRMLCSVFHCPIFCVWWTTFRSESNANDVPSDENQRRGPVGFFCRLKNMLVSLQLYIIETNQLGYVVCVLHFRRYRVNIFMTLVIIFSSNDKLFETL